MRPRVEELEARETPANLALWLRDPERESSDGWLEKTRRAHFAERTQPAGEPVADLADEAKFDESDDKLAAYNRWLASINTPDRP